MDGKTKDPNELGALWISEKGTYMTGTIAGQKVVVFRNDRKTPGSNQPDWRVMKPMRRNTTPPAPAMPFDDDVPF